MGILARIEQIRDVEHRKLRVALARADTVLRELEEKRVEATKVAPRVDMWGEPVRAFENHKHTYDPTVATKLPQNHLGELLEVWEPFQESLLARLDAWEEKLWPMVRKWSDGEISAEEIQQTAADLLTSRDAADQFLKRVRNLAWFVPEASSPFHTVYAALEICDRAEQDEVIPALLSGSRETADHTERSHTADDVARNLRARVPSKPPERPRPPAPKGPLERLKSWLNGEG
jgi:hypothetical protein